MGLTKSGVFPKLVVDFGEAYPLQLALPHFQTNPKRIQTEFTAVSTAHFSMCSFKDMDLTIN